MAVFRVEKHSDFTVIANYIFKDYRLSAKAKGILTQMLSLHDGWDYTLKGLTCLFADGVDSIRAGIHELEHYGYIVRKRIRDEKGRLCGTEYIIYEKPQKMEKDAEELAPVFLSPTEGLPVGETPTQENATTYKELTESSKKESNTDTINPSFPFLQVSREEEAKGKETRVDEMACYRELIQENIDYDALLCDHPEDRDKLDEVVELLTETVCSTKKSVRVGGNDYPAEVVRSRLLKLGAEHIRFVFDCMRENTTKVRNIRQYLLTALYNAPSTIENYYLSRVNHDLYGEG